MATLVNRTLSLLVYATYLVAAYHFAGPGAVLKIGMFLLLPMACIWFPEALGQYTGMMHYHSITSPTPAVLVCAAGWLIMVGLPLLVYCGELHTISVTNRRANSESVREQAYLQLCCKS